MPLLFLQTYIKNIYTTSLERRVKGRPYTREEEDSWYIYIESCLFNSSQPLNSSTLWDNPGLQNHGSSSVSILCFVILFEKFPWLHKNSQRKLDRENSPSLLLLHFDWECLFKGFLLSSIQNICSLLSHKYIFYDGQNELVHLRSSS